jgi:hypothetical protein
LRDTARSSDAGVDVGSQYAPHALPQGSIRRQARRSLEGLRHRRNAARRAFFRVDTKCRRRMKRRSTLSGFRAVASACRNKRAAKVTLHGAWPPSSIRRTLRCPVRRSNAPKSLCRISVGPRPVCVLRTRWWRSGRERIFHLSEICAFRKRGTKHLHCARRTKASSSRTATREPWELCRLWASRIRDR